MDTSRVAVRTDVSVGMSDGVTNTHIRKQIQRLRLSKGWTEHDLEQAAGMAANSLDGLEAGIRRINVDVLRKIIEALDSDITEVWPSAKDEGNDQPPLLRVQASDPLHFSRLAEIHSLSGGEASCLFTSCEPPGDTKPAAKVEPEPALRTLCAINLDEDERERLCRRLRKGTVTAPWVTYHQSENGCSLYLCLKNPRLEFWAEGFVERCLSAWLASAPR